MLQLEWGVQATGHLIKDSFFSLPSGLTAEYSSLLFWARKFWSLLSELPTLPVFQALLRMSERLAVVWSQNTRRWFQMLPSLRLKHEG